MLVITLLVILSLSTFGCAQEECFGKCGEKYPQLDQEQVACKEGCRLQVIFEFANGRGAAASRDDCYNGCFKSYSNETDNEACKFGCASQPNMKKSGNVHLTFTNSEPGFDVALGALRKVFANSFPSFNDRISSSLSSGEGKDSGILMKNPFEDFHQQMFEELEQFQQIANNMLNMQRGNAINPMVVIQRPKGHNINALEGPSVGNYDNVGQVIIDAEPVNMRKSGRLLGYQGENPTVVEIKDMSLLSRLATRARRLSILSRWLVCAALFLCLVSMLSISLAIIKQIKSQRYHNFRSAHVMMAPTFMEPKKVPLDASSRMNDYAMVHDTPPPAYDQLSIHKDAGEPTDLATPRI